MPDLEPVSMQQNNKNINIEKKKADRIARDTEKKRRKEEKLATRTESQFEAAQGEIIKKKKKKRKEKDRRKEEVAESVLEEDNVKNASLTSTKGLKNNTNKLLEEISNKKKKKSKENDKSASMTETEGLKNNTNESLEEISNKKKKKSKENVKSASLTEPKVSDSITDESREKFSKRRKKQKGENKRKEVVAESTLKEKKTDKKRKREESNQSESGREKSQEPKKKRRKTGKHEQIREEEVSECAYGEEKEMNVSLTGTKQLKSNTNKEISKRKKKKKHNKKEKTDKENDGTSRPTSDGEQKSKQKENKKEPLVLDEAMFDSAETECTEVKKKNKKNKKHKENNEPTDSDEPIFDSAETKCTEVKKKKKKKYVDNVLVRKEANSNKTDEVAEKMPKKKKKKKSTEKTSPVENNEANNVIDLTCQDCEEEKISIEEKTKKKKKKKQKNVPIHQVHSSNVDEVEQMPKKKKKKSTEKTSPIENDKANNIIDLTSHYCDEEKISMEEKTKKKKKKKRKNVQLHQVHSSNVDEAKEQMSKKKKKKKSTEKARPIKNDEANNIIDLTSQDSEEEQSSMGEKTEKKKNKNKKSVCGNKSTSSILKSSATTKPEKTKKRKLIDCDGNMFLSQPKKKKRRKESGGYVSDIEYDKKMKQTELMELKGNDLHVDSQLKQKKKKKKSKECKQSNSFSDQNQNNTVDNSIEIISSANKEEIEEDHSSYRHKTTDTDSDNDFGDEDENVNSDSEDSMFPKSLTYQEQAKRRDLYGRLPTIVKTTVNNTERKGKDAAVNSQCNPLGINPVDENIPSSDRENMKDKFTQLKNINKHMGVLPELEFKFDDLDMCCDYVKTMPWQDSPNAEKLHKLPRKQLSKADVEKLAKEGITVKRGRWLREEEHRLRMNFKAFKEAHKLLLLDIDSNDLLICGQELYTRDEHKWKKIQELRKNHNFVACLCLGLERDIRTVVKTAMEILHTNWGKRQFTQEDDAQLQNLIAQFGQNQPTKIAAIMGRTMMQVCSRICHVSKNVNKGEWAAHESQALRQAVQQVAKNCGKDPMQPGNRFPWTKVADLIPSRNSKQCSMKWRRIGHCGINEECNKQINARLRVEMVNYLEKLVYKETEPLDDRAIDWTQAAKEIGYPNRELCYNEWYQMRFKVVRYQPEISVQGVLEKLGPLTEHWKKTAGMHELVTTPANKEHVSEPWPAIAFQQAVDRASNKTKAESEKKESSKETVSVDSSSDVDSD